ncbi:MAG: hypothetical protein WDL87_03385 [Candidatus Omnitrophota bacterium]|jgi:hypothetical protein
MDTQERLKLKKRYEVLPDEALLEMIAEGKDAYSPGAFELLVEEKEKRGIAESHLVQPSVTCESGEDEVQSEELPSEQYIALAIIVEYKDYEYAVSLLKNSDVLYSFEKLSLKGAQFPVSLIVQEKAVKKAIALLQGFKPAGGMVFW